MESSRRMALLLGFLAVTVGLSAAESQGAEASSNLAEVRSFDAYRVYYAGDELSGFPLTEVIKWDSAGNRGRRASWSFFYGDCQPPCAPPAEIQNYSTCRRWAGAYPGRPRLFSFRGAKAAWVPSAGSFEVYTGRTTAVIFGDSRRLMLEAGRLLRTVRQRRPRPLPPPAKGSLWGRLPCQDKPG